MNGYTAWHWHLTKNTESDTENNINQCVMSYYYYPTSVYHGVDLHHFAQAMPEELKGENAVEAYRRFYHKDKATFASWKVRGKPHWWNEEQADYEQRITR